MLRFDLTKASFIPPNPIRELRDLTRYRTKLGQEMTAEKNRVQKVLEGANIKLAGVAMDIFGVYAAPEDIAALACGKLRKKTPELIESLKGNVSEHHRCLIRMSLRHLDYMAELIAELDERIDNAMKPYQPQEELITTITGVDKKSAESIIAEIGVNMSRFPTAAHLASWAGICSGNNKSAGKRMSGKIINAI